MTNKKFSNSATLKSILVILFIFAMIGVLAYLYEQMLDEFNVENITYDYQSHLKQDTPPFQMTPEVSQLLSLPLTYIGKGHQSYVFGNDSSPYVVKIVRFNYLKPTVISSILEVIPSLKQERESKQKRFWRVFNGYAIGYQKNPQYSGLVAVHLQPTEGVLQPITLIDRYGKEQKVDLNPAAFVIQKKAVPLREVFSDLLKKGDVDLVKRKLRQIFKMYITEYQSGLFDEDHNLMINVGFAGDVPVRMDLGKVKEMPEISDRTVYKQDLHKIVNKRLDPWFKKKFPAYRDQLRQYMDELLSAS